MILGIPTGLSNALSHFVLADLVGCQILLQLASPPHEAWTGMLASQSTWSGQPVLRSVTNP